MIAKLLIASCLVATTVTIHAAGLGMVLSHVSRSTVRPEDTRFWPITWLLIRSAWFLIVFHLFEVAVWALFFWWEKCMPDVEASFYVSGITYLARGDGDWVFPKADRPLGAVEGFMGALWNGLSTALCV